MDKFYGLENVELYNICKNTGIYWFQFLRGFKVSVFDYLVFGKIENNFSLKVTKHPRENFYLKWKLPS